MSRPSTASTTLFSLAREYFGLDQQTLAAGLGTSREHLANMETGRRGHNATVRERLRPLLAALPTTPESETTAPAAGLAAPAPEALAARLDYCQHHAERLRRALHKLEQPFEHARRWQRALPGLLAAAEAAPDAHLRRWLLRRQAQAATDLDALASADYHLLRLRLLALDTEAAGLAALLPPAP